MPTESVGIFIIYAVAIKTKWQCCTQQISMVLVVKRRFTFWACFKTAVKPHVLFRCFQDNTLYRFIHINGRSFRITVWKFRQWLHNFSNILPESVSRIIANGTTAQSDASTNKLVPVVVHAFSTAKKGAKAERRKHNHDQVHTKHELYHVALSAFLLHLYDQLTNDLNENGLGTENNQNKGYY